MTDPEESHSDSLIKLAPGASIRPDDLRYTFSRSGGPGGQNVNKLNTKAELRVLISCILGLTEAARERLRTLAGQRLTKHDEIVIHAASSRSQLDNREASLQRLQELVTKAMVAPKKRKKKRPTRSMIEKRLESKRRISDKKQRRTKPPRDDH